MRPDAVIFDCDGVLVDSEPLSNRVLSELLGEHGVEMSPEECRRTFVGLNPGGVATKLRELRGVDLTLPLTTFGVPRFMAVLERVGLAAIEGVAEVLTHLERRGTLFAVASNSPALELRLKLKLAGLIERFEPHVHSGDALGRSKPDPGVYLHAAEHLGVEAGRCIVIEDTVTGVTAGIRAGMRVLGFVGTHDTPEQRGSLRSAGAYEVVSSMRQVMEHL